LVKGQYQAVHESSTQNVTNVQEMFAVILFSYYIRQRTLSFRKWLPGGVLVTSWWKPFLQRTLSYDARVRKSGQVHLTEQEQYWMMVGFDQSWLELVEVD
jgi:hypothetical protein